MAERSAAKKAMVFIDGEDVGEFTSLSIDIEGSEDKHPRVGRIHIDDFYHQVNSYGQQPVLVDSSSLIALLNEVLVNREIILMNKGVLTKDEFKAFDKASNGTDAALCLANNR